MKREDILSIAAEYVSRDRNSQYGEPENNFGRIAAYWSAHLDTNICVSDVAVMMTLLKLARIKGNPDHLDSWIDGAGYLACGGEIVSAAPAEPDRETAMVQAIIREWAQPDGSMTYFDGAPV